MVVAIIGSRNLTINNIADYIPNGITEIVSGGAKGIDNCAKIYAVENSVKLTEILPEYKKYGRVAPLKRNMQIIDRADLVIAFWDGKSRGTKFVIDNCRRLKKDIKIYKFKAKI